MTKHAGQSDVDSVRDATDLVRLIGEHVALRPKGREHVGLCPFHDDKNPSFAVVTHKGNAFYKCHSCGAGGDVFDFVKNYHKMEFGEALRFLADRAGITLKPRVRSTSSDSDSQRDEKSSVRANLRRANQFAATFFQRMLNDQAAGAAARKVIATRGISDEMVQAFMIGAAADQWDSLTNLIRNRSLPENVFVAAGLIKPRKESEGHYDSFRNRVIFPICDDLGNPIAFGARKINPEDEPKYLNSSESVIFNKSKTLYGLNRAKRSIIETKQAIITEGYTDVIACHQAGITNAVGTLGTALTREHARMLSRLCDTVVLVFDGDEAGQKAADRGLEVFFAEPVDVKICVLPDEFDPDELLKEPNGRARFDQAVANSIDALEYKINRFRTQLESAGGISGKQKRLEGFLAELSNLGFGSMQGVRKSMVTGHLAEMLNISTADIEAALPKQRKFIAAAAAELSGESEDSDSLESVDGESLVAPARLRAERDLLAILIYEPSLHVQIGDELSVGHFADPISRMLAQAMFVHFVVGNTFTVQQLLSQLDHPEARSLASGLFFEGERLCSLRAANSPTSGEDLSISNLRHAVQSLQAHIEFENFQSTVTTFRQCKDAPDKAIHAAQAVIEQRRRQGHIAAAIGRGVRS